MTLEQRRALALASARLRAQRPPGPSAAEQVANDSITRGAKDFNADAGFFENAAAGAGAQLTDMGNAALQMVGMGPTSDEVQAKRRLDSTLDETGGGKVGRFVGAVVPAAATMMIPGANTFTGAAAVGGAMGALNPVTDDESRLMNTAIGAGTGVAGKAAVDKVAGALAGRLSKQTIAGANAQSRNAIRDATLRDAVKEGYTVPPSTVSPTFIGQKLESLAGKAAVGQESALRNQAVTNSLARRAIGLADDAPIDKGAIESVRKQAGQVYQEIAALDPRAAQALERLKSVRAESKAQWNHYNKSGVPEAMNKAKALDTQAQILERVIDKAAAGAGRPELPEALKQARTLIAKTYDIERALNQGTGDISAPVIGRLFDKGRLSGELETVGRFAKAFPQFSREGARVASPGVSGTDAFVSGALGTTGYAAAGPAGALAAGIPLLRGPARSAVLSRPVQEAIAASGYGPGAALRLSAGASNNPMLQSASRAALVDAILAQSQQQ